MGKAVSHRSGSNLETKQGPQDDPMALVGLQFGTSVFCDELA